MPAWSDAAGQDESHHAEPPKNRSTMTAYQKLVRSPSATLRASSDPITPFSVARVCPSDGETGTSRQVMGHPPKNRHSQDDNLARAAAKISFETSASATIL